MLLALKVSQHVRIKCSFSFQKLIKNPWASQESEAHWLSQVSPLPRTFSWPSLGTSHFKDDLLLHRVFRALAKASGVCDAGDITSVSLNSSFKCFFFLFFFLPLHYSKQMVPERWRGLFYAIQVDIRMFWVYVNEDILTLGGKLIFSESKLFRKVSKFLFGRTAATA